MLEQAVVFECNTANTTKYSTAHEVIGIATEAIDNIMVVPHVQLRDLPIRCSKSARRIPSNVIVEVKLVTIVAHLCIERVCSSPLWVSYICPRSQGSIDSD